jgi:hypothetical protein
MLKRTKDKFSRTKGIIKRGGGQTEEYPDVRGFLTPKLLAYSKMIYETWQKFKTMTNQIDENQASVNSVTIDNPAEEEISSEISNNRYPALRSIAGTLKFLAYAVLAVLLLTIYHFSDNDNGAIIIGSAIVTAGLLFIGLLAASEGILVFIDIEYNTRQIAFNTQNTAKA